MVCPETCMIDDPLVSLISWTASFLIRVPFLNPIKLVDNVVSCAERIPVLLHIWQFYNEGVHFHGILILHRAMVDILGVYFHNDQCIRRSNSCTSDARGVVKIDYHKTFAVCRGFLLLYGPGVPIG
jgi:hypothetical protein